MQEPQYNTMQEPRYNTMQEPQHNSLKRKLVTNFKISNRHTNKIESNPTSDCSAIELIRIWLIFCIFYDFNIITNYTVI